jgi:hypothetical protein
LAPTLANSFCENAASSPCFRNTFIDILINDPSLKKAAALLEAIRTKEDEVTIIKSLMDVMDEKFYYAGGSARSMFVHPTKDIKNQIRGKVNHLLANLEKIEKNPGHFKEISSLFIDNLSR